MANGYNGFGLDEGASQEPRMRRTMTQVRCVPRFGYADTEVRTVGLDVANAHDEVQLAKALRIYFSSRGIADALYDMDVDDDGWFAIINDEAFAQAWGDPVF